MAIDPTGTGGINESAKRRVGQVGQAGIDVTPVAARSHAVDSIEVSEAARRLATPEIPSGSLTPEQMLSISQRIADGTYNGAEAIDAIARSLKAEG